MGRQKRDIPTGRFRHMGRNGDDPNKLSTIMMEYNYGSQPIRKSTDIKCRASDWNPKGNNGRGELRSSYGEDYKRTNTMLMQRLQAIDNALMEFNLKHPRQINAEVIQGFLQGKPMSRQDGGRDFEEYAAENLKREYERNKIGISTYKNGLSNLKMFAEFLIVCNLGTNRPDGIYLGDVSVDLIERHKQWRKEVKGNSDDTINHALTPILKAAQRATDEGLIDVAANAMIQDTRIIIKKKIDEDFTFDGKYLNAEQLQQLKDFTDKCTEPRRKQYLEMFLFAVHACGLRIIDVMTLRWSDVDFTHNVIRKIQVKTRNRNEIPINEGALSILKHWHGQTGNGKFVFGLLDNAFDLNDEAKLYNRSNTVDKSINQSLTVVGEKLEFPFTLTMHCARHTFAVMALNSGLSMSVVSRLMGHSSTDITEKIYAQFLPSTLQNELSKISLNFAPTF